MSSRQPTWIVTGGAGFIGASFTLMARARGLARVVVLDRLRFPSVRASLEPLAHDPAFELIEGSIDEPDTLESLFRVYEPDAIVHCAAETHVDRSIAGPEAFVETNVMGTLRLIEAARAYLGRAPDAKRDAFRFLHVSTDEVFGSLGPNDLPFTEASPYAPNSPYAASKAGSDHLVRAAHATYGFPAIVTHCTNNYGPRQHPEKLIPMAISSAVRDEPIPIYGDGRQRRDWLHVDDHCRGLLAALEKGETGASDIFGAGADVANNDLLAMLCVELDAAMLADRPHARLLRHVIDRPGHDRRYAVDCAHTHAALGWRPERVLAEGLGETVRWYLENAEWVESAFEPIHDGWLERCHRAAGRA